MGCGSCPTPDWTDCRAWRIFALWVTACEGVLWPAGSFVRAYDRNRMEANESIIESDPVALAVRSLMTRASTWDGFVAELLPVLVEKAGEAAAKAKTWPATPRALSGRLRRAAPNLRRTGINISFGRHRAKGTPITITTDNQASQPSASSAPSSAAEEHEFSDDDRVTDDGADAETVSPNPRESAANDGDDGRDDDISPTAGFEEVEWSL
jgi:hypothetical protein